MIIPVLISRFLIRSLTGQPIRAGISGGKQSYTGGVAAGGRENVQCGDAIWAASGQYNKGISGPLPLSCICLFSAYIRGRHLWIEI